MPLYLVKKENSEPVKEFTQADETRAYKIVRDITFKITRRYRDEISYKAGKKVAEQIALTLERALNRHCKTIIEAAQAPPKITAELNKLKDAKKAKRAEIAENIKTGRARLKAINEQIAKQEKILKRRNEIIMDTAKALEVSHYPEIPPPIVKASLMGDDLPPVSGIYFLWKDGLVTYVGQSTKICNRLRLNAHHRLREEHMISYVEIPKEHLIWAECYYIGVARPTENGGTPTRTGATKRELEE